MKKGILIGIFFGVLVCVQSQNLVPNYSFEDTIYCPNGYGQIYNSAFWFRPTLQVGLGTSDYYNNCSNSANPSVGVPNNGVGYQQARTGNAYSGLQVYFSEWELREYIEVPLLVNMIPGKKYCVNFYISLAKNPSAPTYGAIKEIGIYFSQDSILSNSWLHIPVIPQIENNYFLDDTVNWMLISGELIAQGGEKFITIGNFRDDANTSIMNLDSISCSLGNNCQIYYYIEDVSVYLCDCDTTPPVAKFNYTSDTLTATFNNLSSAFSNYWFWDFGDGNTSTEYNPVHTYDSGGVYTVTLVAWYNGCSDTMVASVAVNDVGIGEKAAVGSSSKLLRVYPNPAGEEITVSINTGETNKDFILVIYDVTGRKIKEYSIFKNELKIQTDEFDKGIYFLSLYRDTQLISIQKLCIAK